MTALQGDTVVSSFVRPCDFCFHFAVGLWKDREKLKWATGKKNLHFIFILLCDSNQSERLSFTVNLCLLWRYEDTN